MEESEEEEEEEPEYEGIGRSNLPDLDDEYDIPEMNQRTTYEDLKAGISSLIQNTQQIPDYS